MTGKLFDPHLDLLERRFQALRDQIGARPEACRSELETTLQELSQAIAALRADREAGGTPPPAPPGGLEAQAGQAAQNYAPMSPGAVLPSCEAMLHHIFSAIPDLLTVHDRDFNTIMSNWHGYESLPEAERRGRPKCYRVYHHRDRPCEHCHIPEVLATGQPVKVTKVNPVDGRVREVLSSPIRDESGQVVLVAEHVRDITGRQLADQALRESEARFRAIFATAQDSIFIKDRPFRYTQVNPAMERLFGRPAAEIIGKTDLELVGVADTERIRKQDRRVLNGEVVKGTHTVSVQGVPVTFHYIKAPLEDEAGDIVGICGIARDITDLKQAETALEESEERFRMLFEHAPDAYILADMLGEIIDCNQAAEAVAGYGREELIGNNFACLPWLDFRQQVRLADLLTQTARGEVMGPVDFTLTRKDGGEVIAEGMSLPLSIQGQNLVLTIVRDITARKQAEDALRESEERFRMLFEHAPDSYILSNDQGEIIDCNKATDDLTGYAREELIGNNFACLPILDLQQQIRMTELLAQAEPGKVLGPMDFSLVRKDGREVLVEGKSLPLNIQGRTLVLAIARDITARKQAEAALQESEARFRHISSTISDISFSCSTMPDGSYGIDWLAGAVERITGYSVEEIMAQGCWGFLVMEADQPLFERHITGLTAGASGACELRLRHKNGGIVWVASFAKIVPIPEQPGVFSIYGGLVDISARKQAEEALIESEERYRALFEASPDAITVMDLEMNFVMANRRGSEIWGQDGLNQAAFRKAIEYIVPEDRPRVMAAMQELITTGRTQTFETTMLKQDGTRFPSLNSSALIRDAAGRPQAIFGIARDITALKQAEAGLRESEQLFRSLVEHIALGITLISSDYRIIMTNPAQGNLFHKHPREFIGKECFREFEKRPAVCPHCPGTIAMATGQKAEVETTGVRDDGSSLVGRILAFPSFGPDGEINGFIEVVEDITQNKQVEVALRESEQRFRLMAETIQDVFWIATQRIGKTVYVSPGFEYIWGRTREALYRHPKLFLETVHPEDRERVKAEIIAARERGIPWDHEYRIIRPDGTVRWIHNRGFPIRDDQGRVTLFTGVATDVTEHKAMETQLLQAQKMEAVGRLAGGVAHDFNNLLMAIMGYGELIRAKVLRDDPLYGHLENILKAGERAAALTRQLLTFSRQQIIQPQVMDLNRVILDLEAMLRRLIGEDIDLEVVTTRKPAAVKADPGQMSQIIMNLLVNARDAMPHGGRLTLKTVLLDFKESRRTRFGVAPPGAYVMLLVGDTGVGMDEATQAHVFEPFFTTKEPGKGTGLGLSTVYGIVAQSGGYLDLESTPGAGSTFIIYLPRLEAIVEPPKAKVPITASFQGEETVLLVEDEDMLRGLLAKFLRLHGYTVLEARHGGEALLTCERHPGPIHLMVTDVVMPQMSGRELADRLTPLRPEMKVLYMSGYTEDALVQHGVADLSVSFLQKPFRPIELARRVYATLHLPVTL